MLILGCKNKIQGQKMIAIQRAYGCGNFGDDALMIAAYEITKRAFCPESLLFVEMPIAFPRYFVQGQQAGDHS